MQFRVVIPEHVKAGQTIRIHCPDGTEANVRVPDGLNTGDSFIFEMSVDQLKNPQALLNTLKESSSNNAAATNKNNNKSSSKDSTNSKDANDGTTTTSKNVIHGRKRGFLDREIVNVQDFLLALFVGLIIGVGIVLGFILGVLAVTTPDDVNVNIVSGIQQQQQVPLSGGNSADKNYVGMPQHGSSSGSERLQSTVLSTPATPDDQVLSIKEQIQQRQKQQEQQQQSKS